MANKRAADVVTVSFRFNQPELALLERVARKHKTKKAALMDALAKADLAGGGEPSNEQLLAMLRRRLK